MKIEIESEELTTIGIIFAVVVVVAVVIYNSHNDLRQQLQQQLFKATNTVEGIK